ncbi:hypothetical protein HIM_05142 [Hirsutella minnesotensis 3608]|uniref:Rhodopsin domain-containing protein n=1 Tax=Hirsutella minnesotensis 3608 TaxID=1043627 RepID=A0A0F7ZKN7_9HYPO|nr:hypothetical protein HIM_05142 [Hirsutella minnesotensis 3608]
MAAPLPPGVVDLCQVPALAPPPGVVPNFVDPVNLSLPTLVVGGIFAAISCIFVAGRIYANWAVLDLTLVGYILTKCYTGIIMGLHELSRHAWDVPLCSYLSDYTMKMLFTSNVFLGPTQFVVKVAILTLYLQIFAVQRPVRYAIWGGVALCALVYLPHPIVVFIFSAPRVGHPWIDVVLSGSSTKLAFYAPLHGIGSIIIDIYIFVLPVVILSKLKLAKKKKLQIIAVFLTASLGIISSCFACYWRLVIAFKAGDYTWNEAQLFIWIMVEHDVAIIVGCMPAVAGLVKTQSAKSAFLSSLRSKLQGSHKTISKQSGDETPKQGLILPQYSGRAARADYYELHNSMSDMRTDRSAAEKDFVVQTTSPLEGSILRTTDISQESRPYRAGC